MVRLNALGQSAIEVGDVRLGPEQPYLFAIALYLIVERGKNIPRSALVELIWPKVTDEKQARQRFRQALLRLREAGFPISGANGTLLVAKHDAEADFDFLASPENVRPGQSFEFLPHYAPRISERFLDWVDTQRARVHAGVQRVFLVRMQQARNRGDWAEVDELATECLRLDPYNEEAVMAHAECAVMRGSKREALTILDAYMEALGSQAGTIGLPAKILRTRIAERLTDQRYAMISEQHFVGRESSMKLLLDLLHDAKKGSGSAAFIWGDPGIGKSRLVQEVTQVASMEGARIASTKCQPTDVGRPLSAFADLVPTLKTLPGALGCSGQTLSLLQRLTDRNRDDTLSMHKAGDAAFVAATIRRAVFDLVDAVADEGLLVMVVEDVHWLDEPSWAILRAMVEWSTTRTLFILMTSRTGHPTEGRVTDPDRGLRRHHLLPLGDADSATLLDRLTTEDATPLGRDVRAWAVSAAEGNPYYLRELVRHWMETHQSFGVPQSLSELIEARLNRLSSLGLRTLQLCAAFGKHASFERLEKATGYPNHVLLDAIEELSNAVMLAANDMAVGVKHDLLASAALGRLSPTASRLVHRQVATILEAEISEKHTAALMWECAEHWQRAGESAHALATVRLYAKHLHAVGQVQTCIELCERALPFCVTPNERLETLLVLAGGIKATDGWARLLTVVTEAQSLTTKTSSSGYMVDSLYLLEAEAKWRLRADLDSRVASLMQFASDESKDATHRLEAVYLAMVQCAEEGRREAARTLIGIVDDLESMTTNRALLAHLRMIFHSDYGDASLALRHAQMLLDLETQIGEPWSLTRARANVSLCFRRSGMISECKRLLVENWSFALDHQLDAAAAAAATRLALNALHDEDFAEAELWLDRAHSHADSLDDKGYRGLFLYIGAIIGLRRGDPEPAEEFLREAAYNARAVNFRMRQTFAAITCQLQLFRKHEVNEALLDQMAAEFERHCDLGQHDFFAITLHDALQSRGRAADANRMLRNYAVRRRDMSPLSPSLVAAIKRINGLA